MNRLRNSIYSFFDSHFDELFIIHRYQREFKKPIDLINPKTFNEKILYLALYHRVNSLSVLADKYAVREYVRQRGLGNTLNEIYGVYRKPEEINLNTLPDSFVIKATHGWSWNIICADKKTLDWERASSNLNRWLHINYYQHKREWVYKNIPPRLIVERFLGQNITDYKFFLFQRRTIIYPDRC